MNPIRILLADDHALVRAGIIKLLESMPDVVVVGEASDGMQLLELAAAQAPHLVLVDIAMPGLNGLDAAARLHKNQPELRVIILSMHQDDQYVRQALRSGASGYLLKDAAPLELQLAIQAVVRGDTYLSPAITRGVMSDYAARLRNEAEQDVPLSPRQREVLQLIAEGLSSKEIALRLGLSVKTVDSHRTLLMKQLDIHEVTGLVRYALRKGIIAP